MISRWQDLGFLVIGCVLLISIPASCIYNGGMPDWKKIKEESDQSLRNEGAKARSNGVPATANPYVGVWGEQLKAKLWLDGWQDGATK